MLRKAVILLTMLTAASILILPSIHSTTNVSLEAKVPFNGMMMSYQTYNTYAAMDPISTQVGTFYGNSSEPNYLWVKGIGSTVKIDILTRKVVGQEGYSEALFPTNLRLGDKVLTSGVYVTITGSQRMSVLGKEVDAWIAYYDGRPATNWQYSWFYDKKTGILLGRVIVSYNYQDNMSYATSTFLINTNAPMFE